MIQYTYHPKIGAPIDGTAENWLRASENLAEVVRQYEPGQETMVAAHPVAYMTASGAAASTHAPEDRLQFSDRGRDILRR